MSAEAVVWIAFRSRLNPEGSASTMADDELFCPYPHVSPAEVLREVERLSQIRLLILCGGKSKTATAAPRSIHLQDRLELKRYGQRLRDCSPRVSMPTCFTYFNMVMFMWFVSLDSCCDLVSTDVAIFVAT